jgi:Adenine-specific DNA methylase containing a Zn-ribbon
MKRFIEELLPIKEISEESARERNIRHGHISTLHIWWARKPLIASRATIYSALVSAENIEEKKKFLLKIAKWETSLNKELIEKAREEIRKENGGKVLRVLDPFSGGGSIPLECLRLGLETHAIDYNPVAVLILKCVLEYPQKYGRPQKVVEQNGFYKQEKQESPLIKDVQRWGEWVLESAKKEIGRFYPADEDGSIPVGYLWARTIPCQNPLCGAEIPLIRQFWLAKKEKKKISLYPFVYNKRVEFAIVKKEGNKWKVLESSVEGFEPKVPENFDPEKGTTARAKAVCLVCGSTIEDDDVRRLFREGKASQRMTAVVLSTQKGEGKSYRLATEKDLEFYRLAEEYLEEKRKRLWEEWGIDPVPDEPLRRVPVTFGVINVWVYGMNTWGDLFNSRQKLALITFTEKVRLAYKKMLEGGYDKDYAKAVVSYLGLLIGKLADWNSVLSVWRPDQERNEHVFNRQALPMVWDYGERNPFEGSLMDVNGNIISILSHLTQIPPVEAEE